MSAAPTTPVPVLANRDPALDAFAAEVGGSGAIGVRGGSTRWQTGGPLAAGTRELAAPAGIVRIVPDEMTATVRAGTTVADLHAALAGVGQRTALPKRPGGTVGGALVVGEDSLHRRGRGRVRDALLQVRYVSADGRLVTAGGPVVKNVSGFDLCRLVVGSLGTLGLVVEAIVRTQPVPPVSRWLAGEVAPGVVAGLRTASAALTDGRTTWLHLEGVLADVEAEQELVSSAGTVEDAPGPPPVPPARYHLTPSAAAALDPDQDGPFLAELGVGTVHVSGATPRPAPDPGVAAIADRLKQAFDPTGRLNPGRDPARR